MRPPDASAGPVPADIDTTLDIAAIEAFALSIPLQERLVTPMGVVDSIPGLFVRVRLRSGHEGWGEVWCNFPRFGNLHRARYVRDIVAPFLTSRNLPSPQAAWQALTRASDTLRLQSGEAGPIANVLAGVDIALWDAVARRAGQPLWKVLGAAHGRVNVYASTALNTQIEQTLERCLALGFEGFKLKTWNDPAQHLPMLERARQQVGPHAELMADANGSWSVQQTCEWLPRYAHLNMAFMEEPVAQDTPDADWQRITEAAPMPVAGGENLISQALFDRALAQGPYRVIQPDVCKWGGFSGLVPLLPRFEAQSLRLCPHMFSGAIGLLASAHLMAASRDPRTSMEYGVEFNPIRDNFVQPVFTRSLFDVGDAPGLGLALSPEQLAPFIVSF